MRGLIRGLFVECPELIAFWIGERVLKVPNTFSIYRGIAKNAVIPVDVHVTIDLVDAVTGVLAIALECFTQRHGRVRHPDNGAQQKLISKGSRSEFLEFSDGLTRATALTVGCA